MFDSTNFLDGGQRYHLTRNKKMVLRLTRAAFHADLIAWFFFFSDKLHNLRSRNPYLVSILARKITGVGEQEFSCCLYVPMQVNHATEDECSEPE